MMPHRLNHHVTKDCAPNRSIFDSCGLSLPQTLARLLKRMFAVDLKCCPRCQSGTLKIIAAITSGPVIRRILRHLKLEAAPHRLHPPAWAFA